MKTKKLHNNILVNNYLQLNIFRKNNPVLDKVNS